MRWAVSCSGPRCRLWRLEVATADLSGQAQLVFTVPAEKAPARLDGRVTKATARTLAAGQRGPGRAGVRGRGAGRRLPEVAPRVERQLGPRPGMGSGAAEGDRARNPRESHAGFRSGLDRVDRHRRRPEDGEVHARFKKKAAFLALVPAGTKRGARSRSRSRSRPVSALPRTMRSSGSSGRDAARASRSPRALSSFFRPSGRPAGPPGPGAAFLLSAHAAHVPRLGGCDPPETARARCRQQVKVL